MPQTTLHDALGQALHDIEERKALGGVETIGLKTGFKQIDHITGGLRFDASYLLAARPGMGKSSLALAISMNVARENQKTTFLSLEMNASILAMRVLAMETGIDAMRIERGLLSDDEMRCVRAVRDIAANITFDILDDSITSDQFAENMQEQKVKHGLDFLVIDYLSLFRDKNPSDYQRLSIISKTVRNIARVCNIPTLSLMQLNREVEKREANLPILSDIRSSGELEEDAFSVWFAYRPQYYEQMFNGAPPVEVERDAQLIIAKNRQGISGVSIPLHFYPSQMLWTDPERKEDLPPQAQTSLKQKVQEGRK